MELERVKEIGRLEGQGGEGREGDRAGGRYGGGGSECEGTSVCARKGPLYCANHPFTLASRHFDNTSLPRSSGRTLTSAASPTARTR